MLRRVGGDYASNGSAPEERGDSKLETEKWFGLDEPAAGICWHLCPWPDVGDDDDDDEADDNDDDDADDNDNDNDEGYDDGDEDDRHEPRVRVPTSHTRHAAGTRIYSPLC